MEAWFTRLVHLKFTATKPANIRKIFVQKCTLKLAVTCSNTFFFVLGLIVIEVNNFFCLPFALILLYKFKDRDTGWNKSSHGRLATQLVLSVIEFLGGSAVIQKNCGAQKRKAVSLKRTEKTTLTSFSRSQTCIIFQWKGVFGKILYIVFLFIMSVLC